MLWWWGRREVVPLGGRMGMGVADKGLVEKCWHIAEDKSYLELIGKTYSSCWFFVSKRCFSCAVGCVLAGLTIFPHCFSEK